MTGAIFWERTNALIKERNTTQEAIASLVDIKYQTFRQMSASGTFPRANAAYKIAQALNTTVEYLVTGKETNTAQQELKALKQKLFDLSQS